MTDKGRKQYIEWKFWHFFSNFEQCSSLVRYYLTGQNLNIKKGENYEHLMLICLTLHTLLLSWCQRTIYV